MCRLNLYIAVVTLCICPVCQSPRAWPRQPSVTEYQVKLWAKYLRTHFVTEEGLHLRRSIGKWTNDSNLEWRYTQSPTNVLFDMTLRLQAIPVRSARSTRRATPFGAWRHAPRITTFSTPATVSSLYPLTAVSRGTTVQVPPPIPTPTSFAAHLLLQPPGPRRLLQKFDQHVSDTCMIEHLRSIKSKTISTDGGLSLIGQGTFGWMLTDAQGKKLVTGSGPVDGPADQASSTRNELHGFATEGSLLVETSMIDSASFLVELLRDILKKSGVWVLRGGVIGNMSQYAGLT